MATILLQVAGASLGGVFGPVGTAIGSAIGATVGGMLDTALINSTRTIAGQGLERRAHSLRRRGRADAAACTARCAWPAR
jgi:phage tail tape-measure protein